MSQILYIHAKHIRSIDSLTISCGHRHRCPRLGPEFRNTLDLVWTSTSEQVYIHSLACNVRTRCINFSINHSTSYSETVSPSHEDDPTPGLGHLHPLTCIGLTSPIARQQLAGRANPTAVRTSTSFQRCTPKAGFWDPRQRDTIDRRPIPVKVYRIWNSHPHLSRY